MNGTDTVEETREAERGVVRRRRSVWHEQLRDCPRRLEPLPPPATVVTCWCCRAELQVIWCGSHDGAMAHGRDLSDPIDRHVWLVTLPGAFTYVRP